MTIVHQAGTKHQNADSLSRNSLPNDPSNPAYDPEDNDIFPIVKINRLNIEAPIMGIQVCELNESLFNSIKESYNSGMKTLITIMESTSPPSELINSLPEPLLKP